MTTRRNGIIKALVAAMAFVGGVVKAQEKATPEKERGPINTYTGTGVVAFADPPKFSLSLSLDNSLGIYVELKGERIHITPEEIMEALRKP